MNAHKQVTNFVAFDLEMNQPTDTIIQIGAVAGNIFTGEILEEMSVIIYTDEKLCTDSNICDIPKLTGITDEMVKDGISLPEGYKMLSDLRTKHDCHRNPIVWGGGDVGCLKEQLIRDYDMQFSTGFGVNKHLPMFCFGMRWFDAKSFFQIHKFMNGESMQSGLKKAIKRMGMQFKGKGHDAKDDALNTFNIAHVLFNEFVKEIGEDNGK